MANLMKSKSQRFVRSYGSLLNIFRPAKSRTKEILAKSDSEQLYNDWLAVGSDMRSAMSLISKETKNYDR